MDRKQEASTMRFGVIFPQTEITADPAAVRDYAQAAEDLGYAHILTYDHVIGADPAKHPGFRGAYNVHSLFHEPFVLFGYLAGFTRQIEFITGILILPQRQTVLVAKQAAEVDVLTGGRFRLGVGVGWNPIEYEALNEDFHNRGKRSEEQIAVLRALFMQESVTFDGRWHHIDGAGICPLPVQRPIPIWIGGTSDTTMRRIGRTGDGWLPQGPPDDEARRRIELIREAAREAERDPAAVEIEARVSIANSQPDDWVRQVEAWRALGATRLGVNTMRAGLKGPDEHIDAIKRFKEVVQ